MDTSYGGSSSGGSGNASASDGDSASGIGSDIDSGYSRKLVTMVLAVVVEMTTKHY